MNRRIVYNIEDVNLEGYKLTSKEEYKVVGKPNTIYYLEIYRNGKDYIDHTYSDDDSGHWSIPWDSEEDEYDDDWLYPLRINKEERSY